MQFKSIPVPSGRYPKVLSTTGACTKKNYTDSKSGKLGAFHHFLGAIVVEVTSRHFWIRQLNADRETGEFYDLLDGRYTKFTAEGPVPAEPAAGLVLGDTHHGFTDPSVEEATFGDGGMVDTFSPARVVEHDVHDGYASNPHHAGNPFISYGKAISGMGSVEKEVRKVCKYLHDLSERGDFELAVVPSNHDDFLFRWLKNTDWRTTPGNAKFYLETALAVLNSTKMTTQGTSYDDPFRYWLAKLAPKVKAIAADESYSILGIECGMHGDNGPNGTRATMQNLARLGTRNITGHRHSPGIEEGHYGVGTSSYLRLEYNRGPSSWLQTHCLIHPNGKRTLITMIEGRWHL
jgi:hypothetical protein